jgi:hypothetical protein
MRYLGIKPFHHIILTHMKYSAVLSCLVFISGIAEAQVQVDKPLDLTGGDGHRMITNLEAPVSGTDAANKDYVDAAVAAGGGGGGNNPTMLSDESATTMHYFAALKYCHDLTEGGFDDWYLPGVLDISAYFEQSSVVPNDTNNKIWLRHDTSNYAVLAERTPAMYLGIFMQLTQSYSNDMNRVRCVR